MSLVKQHQTKLPFDFFNIVTTLVVAGKIWRSQRASTWSAAIAFQTIFALAPIILLILFALSIFLGSGQAQAEFILQVERTLDPASAKLIATLVESLVGETNQNLTSLLAFLLLFAASDNLVSTFRKFLNHIWDCPRPKPFVHLVLGRLVSVIVVFLGGIGLIFSWFLNSVAKFFMNNIWFFDWRIGVLEEFLPTILLPFFLALVFKILIRKPTKYSNLLFGALVASFMLIILRLILDFFLSNVDFGSIFGAASSLVVFLLWVYWGLQIILYGAIVARVWQEQDLGNLLV